MFIILQIDEQKAAWVGNSGEEFDGVQHGHFSDFSFGVKQGIEFTAVRKSFNELDEGHCGSIERAKALVQMGQCPYRFVIVRGHVDCVPFAKEVEDGRLVIIGEGLDEQVI